MKDASIFWVTYNEGAMAEGVICFITDGRFSEMPIVGPRDLKSNYLINGS
jgi:hypothetical protein